MKHRNTLKSLVLITSLVAGTVIHTIQPALALEADPAGDLAEFNDASGIRLKYPRGWSVVKKPDRDTIVKFSGTAAPNVDAEISASLIDDGGLKVDDFAQVFGTLMFAKLSRVRKSSLQKIYVGASGRLAGQLQTVSLRWMACQFIKSICLYRLEQKSWLLL